MGIQGALAGLLLTGPAHGYQIQSTLAGELGSLWVTKASQVYLTLGRMQRDGLVSSSRVPQESRPDRQLLALTPQGRRVGLDWLEQPGNREEIVVRLAVARVVAPERFRALADTMVVERSATLRSLRALRHRATVGFQREAVEAEMLRVQAEVRWLASVRDRAAAIVAMPRGLKAGE